MDSLKSYLNKGVSSVRNAWGTSISFFQEAWIELWKVYYPSPKETMQATIVVVALTLVLALWLGVIDMMATRGVHFLIG